MNRAIGLDLSYYDINFDPAKATQHIDFVIQRVSYGAEVGTVVKDSAFDKLQTGVQKIGIRGAYHYFSTHSPWQKQADFFLSVVKDKSFQFYALDFESLYNQLSIQSACDCDLWMKYVQEKTKKPILFYTNPSLYDNYAWKYCSKWPLWLAQYWLSPSPDKNPRMPMKRNDWLIWQWASEKNYVGHSKEYGCGAISVDINLFNGTVDNMHTWLNIPSLPIVPENKTIKILAWPWLRIRSSPSITYNVVGVLGYHTKTKVLDIDIVDKNQWAKLENGNWCAIIYNGEKLAEIINE